MSAAIAAAWSWLVGSVWVRRLGAIALAIGLLVAGWRYLGGWLAEKAAAASLAAAQLQDAKNENARLRGENARIKAQADTYKAALENPRQHRWIECNGTLTVTRSANGDELYSCAGIGSSGEISEPVFPPAIEPIAPGPRTPVPGSALTLPRWSIMAGAGYRFEDPRAPMYALGVDLRLGDRGAGVWLLGMKPWGLLAGGRLGVF